jgi:ketosteroid isomerase-like protein
LIDLWVAATNSSTFNAVVITDDNVTMNATNIVITSPGNFDRAFCVIEYLLEI